MTTESDVAGLYVQILGRQADPSGLANAVAAVNGGTTYAQIALGLATSPEAQARISALYQSELGRAADGSGLANNTKFLANGGSLAQVEQGLATSPEAQAAIARLYQAELGRSPDSGGAASFTRYLAAGGSLTEVATFLAGSPEAQAQVGALYQQVLDRAASAAELASATRYLAGGGSLAGVRGSLATSDEAANAIQSAYLAASVRPTDAPDTQGTPATDVQIAAGESELLSGVGLATLRGEIADNVGVGKAPVSVSAHVAPVTPATIGGNPLSYVYSLGTSNALIAAQPERVSFDYAFSAVTSGLPGDTTVISALSGSATIAGFNPATDVLVFSRQQATSSSQLSIDQLNLPGGTEVRILSSNTNITLLNVTPDALHASNFRFA